ncbi:radical SAM protein [Bacillus toyonensis]|uniref:radical SAM protein n=1 Tax=Bacillus toyonensis TaxID=155322 RepID=UPI0015CF59EB|nr:radical SAM protein [Bacillus toyonensis]HDR6286403.1 radical SAM protein [Bacillus cereus]
MATSEFIIKIAGTCNLNCSYCYMFNMGDTTFQSRPRIMDKDIARLTIKRIYEYAIQNHIQEVKLILHGGEPLLVGMDWMRWFFEETKKQLPSNLKVRIGLQTNGTLLNREWLTLFKENQVGFGISLDGPPEWHDRFRVDFGGRGSYKQVRRAIDLVLEEQYPKSSWGVLVVANPEFSGVEIYKHFLDIGVQGMDFLWPDYHHDVLPPWPTGSLAKYYINLFDEWYNAANTDVKIRWFEIVIGMMLGNSTQLDSLGAHPIDLVVIESDGSLEPLDVIRTCQNGMSQLGLNVLNHGIDDLYKTDLFQICLSNQDLLPSSCHQCAAYQVCGGGYLPHRWEKNLGFQNPSVHCEDLYTVIKYIAQRIETDLKKTG